MLFRSRTMPPEPKVPQQDGLNIHIDLTWPRGQRERRAPSLAYFQRPTRSARTGTRLRLPHVPLAWPLFSRWTDVGPRKHLKTDSNLEGLRGTRSEFCSDSRYFWGEKPAQVFGGDKLSVQRVAISRILSGAARGLRAVRSFLSPR